jgi:hypothetical protein
MVFERELTITIHVYISMKFSRKWISMLK